MEDSRHVRIVVSIKLEADEERGQRDGQRASPDESGDTTTLTARLEVAEREYDRLRYHADVIAQAVRRVARLPIRKRHYDDETRELVAVDMRLSWADVESLREAATSAEAIATEAEETRCPVPSSRGAKQDSKASGRLTTL
jgi:hypothetical protein